jgi:hypothetical protein
VIGISAQLSKSPCIYAFTEGSFVKNLVTTFPLSVVH